MQRDDSAGNGIVMGIVFGSKLKSTACAMSNCSIIVGELGDGNIFGAAQAEKTIHTNNKHIRLQHRLSICFLDSVFMMFLYQDLLHFFCLVDLCHENFRDGGFKVQVQRVNHDGAG